jgi:hypothetical protein
MSYGSNAVQAMALVDTGATVSVLPDELALQLGLNWDALDKSVILGGRFSGESRLVALKSSVGLWEPIDLIFAWTKMPDAPFILGHINFFIEFDVCFYGSKAVFDVTRL